MLDDDLAPDRRALVIGRSGTCEELEDLGRDAARLELVQAARDRAGATVDRPAAGAAGEGQAALH